MTSSRHASLSPRAGQPSLTIVVASKNRLHDIRACLTSIKVQSTQPDEVIVVDQSTSKYDLSDFEPVVHIHNTLLTGLPAARNVALDRVRTDLVLFLDDDVELLSDCVAQVRSDFVRRPQAAGLGLRITWPEPPGVKSRLWNLVFEHGFFNREPIRRRGGVELRRLVGCAMAYRCSLIAIERFDELLTGYALGEDWEFSARARSRGELWLSEHASVVHRVSPANRLTLQRARKDRWQNFLYFYDKLGAGRLLMNRVWKTWWILGEAVRWLNLGMGLPKNVKALRHPSSFDQPDTAGTTVT